MMVVAIIILSALSLGISWNFGKMSSQHNRLIEELVVCQNEGPNWKERIEEATLNITYYRNGTSQGIG